MTYGMEQWFRYFQDVAAFPQMAVLGSKLDEMIDFVNSGLGVVGTPDRMVEQIKRLVVQSNGGFGVYLVLAHNWANPEATKRSFELFARHVMPHFQSSGSGLQAHADRAHATRAGHAEKQLQAVAEATERYQRERGR